MSHPDPSHDRDNEREEDSTFAPKKHMSISNFKHEMKEIRKPLQKVVGHTRRERHEKAKGLALKKKMK